MDVTYKNALITGASSGLGRGLAAWFAQAGVRVYAAARRIDQLDALRAEAGDHVIPFPLDVARADETHERVKQLDVDCGGLDLVVANAGVGEETAIERLEWERVRHMLDVNVTGAVATLVAPLPAMVARGRGHLVGVSSLAATVPVPRHSTYSASKAFLAMWLGGIRNDVKGVGVHVTSIHPGFVKSEMTAKNTTRMPFLLETADAVERMARAILRKDRTFAFPWQMRTLATVASGMPPALRHAALKRAM